MCRFSVDLTVKKVYLNRALDHNRNKKLAELYTRTVLLETDIFVNTNSNPLKISLLKLKFNKLKNILTTQPINSSNLFKTKKNPYK